MFLLKVVITDWSSWADYLGASSGRSLRIEFGVLREIDLARSTSTEFGDDAVMRESSAVGNSLFMTSYANDS
ncbi:MAG: hypothetical protein H0V18_21360 [Pyrinomonadaceae bacterium]|nr:hypothetical protein [Pyrinomonadaceae bacterium]